MSSMQTECLSQILVCFSSFAGHVASLRRTQICEVANWLIEPSSHPLPVFAQFVSFNSYRKRSVETKLSSFPLFISGGKYTKATNSSLVLIRQKRQWSEPPPTTPKRHAAQLRSRADENKFESGGRRSIRLRMPLWQVSTH